MCVLGVHIVLIYITIHTCVLGGMQRLSEKENYNLVKVTQFIGIKVRGVKVYIT